MRKLLGNRNYLLLWSAQVVSGIGDVLYNVGVMVTIFERTGSALQTAGVLVATTLPQFLLGPFAGALVDDTSRRRTLLAMDLLRGLLVGLLLFFARPTGFNVWGIYAIVAGLSAATTFYNPARQALIPSLVSRQELVRANGLIISTRQATRAVGFAVGGVLIVWLGLSILIVINLVSFLVAGLLAALIRSEDDAQRQVSERRGMRSLLRAIRDGYRYVREEPLPRTLVTMELLEHVPHAVWTSALMLVFVRQALGGDPAAWGYQNAVYSAGELVGATLSVAVATHLSQRPGWFIIGNAFLFGLLTAVYALSPTVPVAIVLVFFFGPTFSLRDVAQDSLLQATVDNEIIGRVYALRSTFSNLTFMISGVILAWLADQISVRWIYLLAGFLYALTALYALRSTAMRQSRMAQPTVQKYW